MKPFTLRPLADSEVRQLHTALRSAVAFTLRRAQYLLAAARGLTTVVIANTYGGSPQAVRNVLKAFTLRGCDCLTPRSSANITPRRHWPRQHDDDLRALLHRSPRDFGHPTSLWTLTRLATVCHTLGYTQRVLSAETIRQILVRLDIPWKRAKHWLTSPDPDYVAKKKRGMI